MAVVVALVAVAGGQRPAGADRRLADLDYARHPSRQRDQVTRRIDRILSPSLTFPALAPAGGRFVAIVLDSKGPDGRALAPRDGGRWQVYLSAPGVPARRCAVVAVHSIGPRRGLQPALEVEIQLPIDLARDVYDLRVVTQGFDDRQANAVRVLGRAAGEDFRFAVVTDHQLWDPSFRLSGRELNGGAYPHPAEQAPSNVVIARQGFAELGLLDPDFVLHTGDLIFGLDYPKEYDQAYGILRAARLPVFAVPGNHDGYAVYTVRLRGSPLDLIRGGVKCRKHLSSDMSWAKAWVFITCLYGDVKRLLYSDLYRDGLTYWTRQLGPPSYAFDRGRLHFVALNTYGGSPERRHAFSIYMDAFDLHLGAPAVDNYGGYLGREQLAFLEREARWAEANGRTLVVFGHHDPRGNGSGDGRRYHPNEGFPTDPLSLSGFEEWNFDSKQWDSDPSDDRAQETQRKNSAVELLRILARYGGYYLSGHVHGDGRRVYASGSDVAGVRVRRQLEFIRTTSASSSVKPGAYWGYRLIEARGDRLAAVDYAPRDGLGSVPAGNLWARPVQGSDPREIELASGLPREARVVVRWELPSRAEGYRFRLRPSEGKVPFDPRRTPRLLQVAEPAPGGQTFWVEVTLPPSRFPPTAARVLRHRLRALVARGNSPPTVAIDLVAAGGPAPDGGPEQGFDALVGQQILLSAERSSDPQGDRVISYTWHFESQAVESGDSVTSSEGGAGPDPAGEASGPRVTKKFSGPGRYRVRLTLVDEAGASATAERDITVRHPPPPAPPPGCSGCCTLSNVALSGGGLTAMLLLVAAWLRGRRRRSQTRQRASEQSSRARTEQ